MFAAMLPMIIAIMEQFVAILVGPFFEEVQMKNIEDLCAMGPTKAVKLTWTLGKIVFFVGTKNAFKLE